MPVVSGENTSFLGDVVVRCDQANNGLTRQEAISTLQELEPDLSRKQATNFFNRTFFQKNKGKVKKNLVKAQKTTTKRSQITVAQQYRWFKKYEEALNWLRQKNTGFCNRTGKQFGEVIEHFVLGGDEKNLIADADGDVKILGDAMKR